MTSPRSIRIHSAPCSPSIQSTLWARAVETSLRADDVAGIVAPGSAVVKPGAELGADEVKKARDGSCDRVVVLGGSGVARSVCAALDRAAWDVPVVCLDTAIDAGPPPRRKMAYVAAMPLWAEMRRPAETAAKHPPAPGKPLTLTPGVLRGFVAAAALIEATFLPGKRGVIATMRELHEGSAATESPLFDGTGNVHHWRWSTWAPAEGVVSPIKAAFLPDAALGPLLGGNLGARYRVLPGATCVRVGFGGGDGPASTIDTDLARIGLSRKAGPAYELAKAEILARTLGKLSHLWSKNHDGSPRAALSFKIAFVPEGTDATGASAVWEAAIAGDGPDGLHGGTSNVKAGRAQALSTYLLRNAKLLQDAALKPPLAASDLTYLDGSYAWNTDAEGNTRADKIRALLDGCASTFCMKLSKEIGHLAGLSVDHSGEARSIMVAQGGEGVSDEFAYFPPAFAKVLEKTLGRVGAEAK